MRTVLRIATVIGFLGAGVVVFLLASCRLQDAHHFRFIGCKQDALRSYADAAFLMFVGLAFYAAASWLVATI